jgi:glycosyltransferase involved in cell wall biosynthesis
MRIAYIAAGAGGMYCGSCIHDNALATALMGLGHEVALLPAYTPLRTDEENVSEERVFYGALNVYLQHTSAFFRRMPRVFDRLFDQRRLLGWVSRLGATTDPRDLGDLTLDVLRGEAGGQAKELDKLVDWLATTYRPDIVQITNSMLLGLVRRLKEELDVPVVVAVQGEDLFLDQLPEAQGRQVTQELRRRAADADLFVAPSRDYAGRMATRLGQDPSRMRVVPLGIKLDGHGVAAPKEDRGGASRASTIGYLARICPDKGLHRLVDAFIELAAGESTRPELRLRVAGYLGPRDREYWGEQETRLREAGLSEATDFVGEVDRDGKIDFLSSLNVLCVPTVYEEPKGLFALEAMANGVPVVLPRHGSFPEMVADTGGGVLFDPDSGEDLVAALRRLVDDREQRATLGRRGKEAVHSKRGAAAMAEATLEVYRELLRAHGENDS